MNKETGRKQDVFYARMYHQNYYDDTRFFEPDIFYIYADSYANEIIPLVDGVLSCTRHAGLNTWTVKIDPRYDTDIVIENIVKFISEGKQT